MSQMRMANNDLYMYEMNHFVVYRFNMCFNRCDYSEGDLEALKQIPKDSITLEK